MPRLTVTISDEHEEILQRQADVGEAYRSKSEVIRECIEAFERVDELSEQLACLEAEVEMLRDQRTQLKQKAARVDELEGKLRQLQAAYHQAIDEGRSPQELEPVETDLETEPSAAALIEEAESDTEEPKPVESTTDQAESTGKATTSETDAVSESSPPRATVASEPSGTGGQSTAQRPTETDRATQTASPNAERRERVQPSAQTRGEESPTESATDGGVEIDEELLYQSPSVGSRIKSALFGGPGGSR